MPDSRDLEPHVQRELDAIDAALAGPPVFADGAHGDSSGDVPQRRSAADRAAGRDGAPDVSVRDADLAALALRLRDERPQIPPAAAARLDRRVSATLSAAPAPGTGRRSGLRGRGAEFFGRAPKFAFAAALASLLIVSVIAVPIFNGSQSGGIGDTSFQEGGAELQAGDSPAGGRVDEQSASAGQESAAGPESAATSGSTPTVDPRNALPANGDPGSRRLVERSAGITLAAPQRELQEVADGVIRTTDALGGFVQASTVSSGSDGADGGYFELRVPAPRLARALTQLSQLASVRQRTQNSQDITAERASEASRLADARAERKSVLRRLARANTDSEAAMLRSRARRLSVRIAGLRRAVRRVDQRAVYATVVVNLVDERSSLDGSATDGRFTPADALRTAGQILAFMASATLVVLAVALPLGLAFMVLVWLSRALRRQQRDQALDSA